MISQNIYKTVFGQLELTNSIAEKSKSNNIK